MSKRTLVFMCKNNPDDFCNVCGLYMLKNKGLTFTEALQNHYFHYFGVLPTLNKPWTPKRICDLCHRKLSKWASGERCYMDFDTAMKWSEPFRHSEDCYFCLSVRSGFGKHLKWEYPKVDSVKFPLPHSSDVPYPECRDSAPKIEGSSEEMLGSSGSLFETSLTQQILSQAELNDWIRDFGFSKGKAELFASRMKERGFVAPDVKTNINISQ